MKKIKLKKLLLLLLLFITILTYSMIIKHITADEIWEYGFGYNISKGLIPYKDFNMVVTPLYPMIISIFIKIFGNYLLSAHIFSSLILLIIINIIYKLIGKKVLIIIPLLLYNNYSILPTYNQLILFLGILLIYIKQTTKSNNKEIIISSLIISMIFLTKQSVGIIFFILELFLTKNKKKYIFFFFLPIILLLIYLLTTNSLSYFIDYCFLGLFDFAEKNTHISPGIILFIIMTIILLLLYKKTKNKNILYTLAFITISFPLFSFSHILLSITFTLFTILNNINYKAYLTKYLIIYTIIPLIIVLALEPRYIYSENNFLKARNIGEKEYINNLIPIIENINYYEKEKYDIYNFTTIYSYIYKIHQNKIINKFDLINNGNMGYQGHQKYINEIEKNCQKNKCLFIIKQEKIKNTDQTNKEIINYVINNYKIIDKDKYYKYYSN